MTHRLAPIPILALLAGCAAGDGRTLLPADICATEAPAALAGRNIGDYRAGPGLVLRVIAPGTPLTEDFNAARLTVWVDDKGWIARAECW